MSWETLKADVAFLDKNVAVLKSSDQNFANSLIDQFNERGLSAKQEYWVTTLAARARQAIDAKTRVVEEVKIDLTGIVELFKKASTNLKKPFVLVEHANGHDTLRLKLAGPSSKYAGQVYVYEDGTYEERVWLGRVDTDRCVFIPSRECADTKGVQRTLEAFSQNPAGAATRYGRKVGACCFCSRQLNDPRSVTVGYGPICADHFGLPWGEVVEVQDWKQDASEELGWEGGARAVGRKGTPNRFSDYGQPVNDLQVPFDDEIPF